MATDYTATTTKMSNKALSDHYRIDSESYTGNSYHIQDSEQVPFGGNMTLAMSEEFQQDKERQSTNYPIDDQQRQLPVKRIKTLKLKKLKKKKIEDLSNAFVNPKEQDVYLNILYKKLFAKQKKKKHKRNLSLNDQN